MVPRSSCYTGNKIPHPLGPNSEPSVSEAREALRTKITALEISRRGVSIDASPGGCTSPIVEKTGFEICPRRCVVLLAPVYGFVGCSQDTMVLCMSQGGHSFS